MSFSITPRFGHNGGPPMLARDAAFDRLEDLYGIHVPPDYVGWLPDDIRNDRIAMDAQPGLITTTSAGIPAYLANYLDPNLIKVLVTPNKAAEIFGEAKKGDWTTLTAQFPVVEHTGEVTTYGDFNSNGQVGANVNFPTRQSYHYQTHTEWGERQLEMAALGKIDWASRLNIASGIVLDKFQNQTYFFGVQGLQNYGLLNDPLLLPPITPGTKVAGGTTWVTPGGIINGTANEIYQDIQSIFIQLTNQSGGLIQADGKFVLAMSPQSSVALTATNQFGINVYDLLKKNFPNIEFQTAMQYSTMAGQLVQMITSEVDGQETGYCAFTEKMRAHAIVKDTSSFKQKKSQGSWGAIVFQPYAIASMIGV